MKGITDSMKDSLALVRAIDSNEDFLDLVRTFTAEECITQLASLAQLANVALSELAIMKHQQPQELFNLLARMVD